MERRIRFSCAIPLVALVLLVTVAGCSDPEQTPEAQELRAKVAGVISAAGPAWSGVRWKTFENVNVRLYMTTALSEYEANRIAKKFGDALADKDGHAPFVHVYDDAGIERGKN